jgi:hypothetical protein
LPRSLEPKGLELRPRDHRHVEDGAGSRRASRYRSPVAEEPPASDAVRETEPLRATIDAVFRNDEAVADAFKENLKRRTLASDAIAERVTKAFEGFSPSSLSSEERGERIYLGPKDGLAKTLDAVHKDGARALRHDDRSRGIRLTVNEELLRKLRNGHGENASTIGRIGHDDLVEYVTERLGTTAALWAEEQAGAYVSCDIEDEAERRLSRIENPDHEPADHAHTPDSPDGGPATDAAGHPKQSTKEFVEAKVNLLLDSVVSPEHPIRIDPGERVDEKALDRSIVTFELRDGPSDVTSYHDFNSLQIAFQHVWTEVFDGELESLGKQLYKEWVQLKDYSGLDAGKDKPISTVDDLAALIGEIKELSRLTQDAIPSTLGGGSGAGDIPAGTGDLRDDPLYKLVTGGFIDDDVARAVANPAGFAVDVVARYLADAQQITWALLENGRLPGGIDVVTAKIEPNALPAGSVEIVLTTSDEAATWKGIDFTEFDTSGRPVGALGQISNGAGDTTTMRLSTRRVKNGMLRFGKEIIFGGHKAQYYLVDLDDKVKDRTRVTFKWEKDRGWDS